MNMNSSERRKYSLTRDDLTVLLDSYRNMIESNLTLMEKQEQILSRIEDTCKAFADMQGDLVNGFNSFRSEMSSVHAHHEQCKAMQQQYNKIITDKLGDNQSEVKDILHDDHLEVTKTHFGQNIKFYGVSGSLVAIILGLIGLIYKIWPKNPIIP